MRINATELLYGNYIKYDRLHYLCSHALYKYDQDVVNIFIDMNSLLQVLYRYDVYFVFSNAITSSIINLCSHIRNYFWNYQHKYTKIYIVYGDNFPSNPRLLNPSYNQNKYGLYTTNSYVTDMINKNIEYLDIIVPYIEDIFFIHDTEVETSILIKAVKDLLYANNENYRSIIYTKDPYAYQLVSIEPRTFGFRPKKAFHEDISYFVQKKHIFDIYRSELNRNREAEILKTNHELFSLIISMSGFKYRNIKGVMRYNKAISILNKAINESFINGKYNTIFDFIFANIFGMDKDTVSIINNNFKSLDLLYNYNIYGNNAKTILNKYLINLNDPEALKEINNIYFSNNPLDLMGF